jgi:lysophospholipase
MKTCLILFLVLMNFSAVAIPEKNFFVGLQNEVTPYFATGIQRSYVNHQGLKLNFYSFLAAKNKKTLVILPGRTEPALKYAEVIYDLRKLGFNIYVLDHQGQGASDRLLADSHKGYVEHFVDYARDLSGWLDEVVVPETQGQDRYLLAHSMGGAISTIYLAYGKPLFKKAVLCAPMMEINTKPYKENIGRILSNVLVLAAQGKKYAPGKGPYLVDEDTFEINEVTHSKARFNYAKAIFVTKPELVLGGPTSRWVSQSLKATKRIDTLAQKITIPILLLQSGMDLIVHPGRQNSFCSKNSNCKKIHYANAYHEILQETDDIRDQALIEIKKFLKE